MSKLINDVFNLIEETDFLKDAGNAISSLGQYASNELSPEQREKLLILKGEASKAAKTAASEGSKMLERTASESDKILTKSTNHDVLGPNALGIGAGILGLGVLGYGGKKLYDHLKNQKKINDN
jgi:hypothetical protein